MVTLNEKLQPSWDITPDEAGYRQETLDRINELLQGLVGDKKLQAASYMFARDGKVFAAEAFGTLSYENSTAPMELDSIRQIASITKWFTLVAMVILMEEGKLHMGQPVKDWIKEFDQVPHNKITVHHLLTHTSGLAADPGYYQEAYPLSWWNIRFAYDDDPREAKPERTREEEIAFRKSQWIKSFLAMNPIVEPGKAWCYSSAGFAVLGEIISRITGMAYEEFVTQRILQPLGLTRTFFQIPKELHGEVCVVEEWDKHRLERNHEEELGSPPASGGGLSSTLRDLTRFGQVMMTGECDGVRIMSRKSVEWIRRDHFPHSIPAFFWGGDFKRFHYGVSAHLPAPSDFFYPSAYYHEGAGRSMLVVDPAERFTAAIFIPTAVDWVPESIITVRNMVFTGLR